MHFPYSCCSGFILDPLGLFVGSTGSVNSHAFKAAVTEPTTTTPSTALKLTPTPALAPTPAPAFTPSPTPTPAELMPYAGGLGAALKAEPTLNPIPTTNPTPIPTHAAVPTTNPPAAKKVKPGSAQRRKMQKAADVAAGAQGHVAEGVAPAKPTPVAGPLTRTGDVNPKTKADAAPQVPTAANSQQSSGTWAHPTSASFPR